MLKWEEFRVARHHAIKAYYKVRKRMTCCTRMVNRATLHQIIALLFKNFRHQVGIVMRRNRFQWASFMMIMRIKRKVRAVTRGATTEERNRQRLRCALTAVGYFVMPF